ncbi:DUF4424 domain-containing protein [Mesorhizobium waimense]|uniref:DUF4424 domain-containing protein n=2 Tax=Mesorhizobium waimense TaxID=1300307 RepID=A0A3A5L996_9HYPH|nr:DUF4424 domain-containing protein [Mesorhizobium waimense]
MESADLIISPEKVTVDYVFRDVKKMGPTTFEMTGKDFYPERDIDILLLELSDDSVGGEGGYGG